MNMDFIYKYFIDPVLQNGWFNPVNTLVYGILLVLGVILVFRLLKRLEISIDERFFAGIFPFIVWACSTRVLHDAAYAGVLSSGLNEFYALPIFPTPGSYFITFGLALCVLILSLLVQKFLEYPYWKVMLGTGVVLSVINFIFLPWRDLFPCLLILWITGTWGIIFFLLGKKFSKLLGFANVCILTAHFFDATATTVAVYLFGYGEQHVIPRLLFPLLGPFTMFLLKIFIVLPVLWVIDRYTENPEFKNLLKITVFILGFAPGLRDTLRLMVNV